MNRKIYIYIMGMVALCASVFGGVAYALVSDFTRVVVADDSYADYLSISNEKVEVFEDSFGVKFYAVDCWNNCVPYGYTK